MSNLSVSIVLYHNDIDELEDVIKCILSSSFVVKLYLIDNSESDCLRNVVSDPRIEYIFNNANIGYGAGHNVGVRKSIECEIKYHVVMNPDISFKEGTLERIYSYMESNQDVGSLMPKVFYQDGTLQRLCKLLPTPFDLIGRRFFSRMKWAKRQNEKYELHNFGYDTILNTPSLSGCFMFIRTSVFEKSGLFDQRYFMYLEDYDLVRRIHNVAKTIFFPEVYVIHGHAKESYKNGQLLKIHMLSAIKYFNKWGWLFDKQRKRLNYNVLKQINKG